MCSVLQSPIPSAPNSKAFMVSSSVSAFALIDNFLNSSQYSISFTKLSDILGGSTSKASVYTSPKDPSRETISPSFRTMSPLEIVFSSIFIVSFSAPTTHGLPIPLATTAA